MVTLEAGLQAQVHVAALAHHLTLTTALPASGALDALALLMRVLRPMASVGCWGGRVACLLLCGSGVAVGGPQLVHELDAEVELGDDRLGFDAVECVGVDFFYCP
jgi:hypothetical protein